MTSVAFKLEGVPELLRDLRAWELRKKGQIMHLIAKTAHAIATDAKKSLKGPGKGRTYRRGSVTHRASVPGDPPATDTGRLRASIRPILTHIASLVGEVEAGTEYAAALEFGTRKMAARPYLIPAFERHAKAFVEELKRILES